ncbi:hypothetical protein AYO44_00905 [Planctomycetaceae bacterium SCGC AG-212-F19]|nr:hypothetical protein AYO44_00905 [Planctomycetaceae bacterium SCGC AG-212-F19]
MKHTLPGLVVAVLIAMSALTAGEIKDVAPSDDAADLLIQGEYQGEIEGKGKWGAQVVARGAGKFQVHFLPGGLPGAGWDDKAKIKRVTVPAATEQGKTMLTESRERWSGAIANDRLIGKTADGSAFTLVRVTRASPASGAKPPEGALVLFDGTNTDHWPKAKMTDDKLLLVPAVTKQRFHDFTIHAEFRVPYPCPSRGNSGLILQNCYEIQILDSFGADASPSGCGGLYVYRKPDVNMSFPPWTWQTFDADFTAARFDAEGNMVERPIVTVRHNGVLIHDKVTLPEKGNIGRPTRDGGPIHLQAHGSAVRFRNIWLVEKK